MNKTGSKKSPDMQIRLESNLHLYVEHVRVTLSVAAWEDNEEGAEGGGADQWGMWRWSGTNAESCWGRQLLPLRGRNTKSL